MWIRKAESDDQLDFDLVILPEIFTFTPDGEPPLHHVTLDQLAEELLKWKLKMPVDSREEWWLNLGTIPGARRNSCVSFGANGNMADNFITRGQRLRLKEELHARGVPYAEEV
jgi:hypothetical protein